jgi:hypothetical protein
MTDENFDSNPQLGEKMYEKNEKNMLMEHEVNH